MSVLLSVEACPETPNGCSPENVPPVRAESAASESETMPPGPSWMGGAGVLVF